MVQCSSETRSARPIALVAFYSIAVVLYLSLFALACVNVKNAHHLISFLSWYTTTTYHLYVVHILCFSDDLCKHVLEYKDMNGSTGYLIPQSPRAIYRQPWDSISQLSHLRGSTANKFHSIIVSLGCTMGLTQSCFKLFEIHDSLCAPHYTVGVWFQLIACIAGIVLANVESNGSPSFSNLKNNCMLITHAVAGLIWGFGATLGYLIWSESAPFPVFLFTLSMIFSTIYITLRVYQKRKRETKGFIIDETHSASDEKAVKLDSQISDDTDDDVSEEEKRRVHRMSLINIGTEMVPICCACVALNLQAFEWGNKC